MTRNQIIKVITDAIDQLRPHRADETACRASAVLLALEGAMGERAEGELCNVISRFTDRRLQAQSFRGN